MKLLEQIMKWRLNRIQADGKEPEFVPLSRNELLELKSDAPAPMVCPTEPSCNTVFGMEPFLTPFASEMRCRAVEIERVPLINECEVSEALEFSETRTSVPGSNIQRRQLRTMVCADTTKIEITFEWDIWARWKRLMRVTRWFPVKTRTVRIDGRVLYPYLKVSLPQNRHHVQFAIRP